MSASSNPGSEPIVVRIDPDLAIFVPEFLEYQQEMVGSLHAAIASLDLAAIDEIGHNLKGSGSTFGFDTISAFGRRLQELNGRRDLAGVSACVRDFEEYLRRLVVEAGPG